MSFPPDDPLRFARLCLERGVIDQATHDQIQKVLQDDPTRDPLALLVEHGVSWEHLDALGALVDLGAAADPSMATTGMVTAAVAPSSPAGSGPRRWPTTAWWVRLTLAAGIVAYFVGWYTASFRTARVEEQLRASRARAEAAEAEILAAQGSTLVSMEALAKTIDDAPQWREVPQAARIRMAILEKVLAYYEQERARRPMDFPLRLGAARSRLAYARGLTRLGPLSQRQAADEYKKSIDLLEQTVASRNELDTLEDLADALQEAGELLRSDGQEIAALPLFARGRVINDAILGKTRDRPPSETRLLKSLPHLARIQTSLNRLQDAEDTYQRLLSLIGDGRASQLVGGKPVDRKLLVESKRNLANLQSRLNKKDDALRTLRDVVKESDSLLLSSPTSLEDRYSKAMAMIELGQAAAQLGVIADATYYTDQAIATLEELRINAPDPSLYLGPLADALITRIGLPAPENLSMRESNLSRAAALYETLVEAKPGILKFRQELAIRYQTLGSFYFQQKRLDAAEPAWIKAVAVRDTLLQLFPQQLERHIDLASALIDLGVVRNGLGRIDEATLDWKRAGELHRAILTHRGSSPEQRVEANRRIDTIATLLKNAGRPRDAEALLNPGPDVDQKRLEKKGGESPPPPR